MKNDEYWAIILDNYEGESKIIYFENYDIAKTNFVLLKMKNKHQPEFEVEKNFCSWFDSKYNEYSTSVTLELKKFEIVNTIIF